MEEAKKRELKNWSVKVYQYLSSRDRDWWVSTIRNIILLIIIVMFLRVVLKHL